MTGPPQLSPPPSPSSIADQPSLTALLQSHPLPSSASGNNTCTHGTPPRYSYGTAGFRYPAPTSSSSSNSTCSPLPSIIIRTTILAALRSLSTNGEGVGMMITASHNGVGDNGVKVADVDGGMLGGVDDGLGGISWEEWAEKLVNADDGVEGVLKVVRTMEGLIAANNNNNGKSGSGSGSNNGSNNQNKRRRMVVHLGHDTRPSSPPLLHLALRTLQTMNATAINHGLLTTPQLHHCVRMANAHRLPNAVPVRQGEGGYRELMGWSYRALVGTKLLEDDGEGGSGGSGNNSSNKERILTVDGACGVGHPKIRDLADMLQKMMMNSASGGDNGGAGGGGSRMATLRPVNGPGDGPLNDGCGAEHVQKNRLPPLIYTGSCGSNKGRHVPLTYAASLDGDADRVVFHYHRRDRDGTQPTFRLLDGDKIAVLVTQFIQEELRELQSGVSGLASMATATNLRCGVVQTAYANGAATAYVRNTVKADVVVAKTGVKYVHAAAHDHFDVGVYFEANGHGTVLFSPPFYRMLDAAEGQLRGRYGHRANVALQRLRLLPSLVNQAVGDAISDLLLVDAILYLKGWTIEEWDGLYEDLPSRQCKVKVRDRSVIRTNDSETRATAPSNLQPALDAAMAASDAALRNGSGGQQHQHAQHPHLAPSRCFVRPSGTENAVRVYAEASTQEAADALASEAAALLHRLCGGVGDPPRPIIRSRI